MTSQISPGAGGTERPVWKPVVCNACKGVFGHVQLRDAAEIVNPFWVCEPCWEVLLARHAPDAVDG